MASNWQCIQLNLVCHSKDFIREKEIIQQEILPELKTWCELHKFDLHLKKHCLDSTNDVIRKNMPEDISYYLCLLNDSVIWPHFHDEPPAEPPDNISDQKTNTLNLILSQELPNVLLMHRRDEKLKQLLTAEELQQFLYVCYGTQTSDSARQLARLQHHVIDYQYDYAEWDNKSNKLQGELGSTFKQQIIEYMKEKITQDDQPEACHAEPAQSMEEAQQAFVQLSSPKVKGRMNLIQEIEEYIFHGDTDVPLLLLGAAGSGKSSAMAKATALLEQRLKQSKNLSSTSPDWKLLYHFVGAVPGSTELGSLLRRLLIKMDVVCASNLPRDLDSAAQLTCNTLANGNTGPLILLVEAVNQFDEDPAAQVVSWVPRKLGPNIRVVLSMINDSPQQKILHSREPQPQEMEIMPLDFESKKKKVPTVLKKATVRLTQHEINLILAKPSSANPLWLTVACQKLKRLKDSEEITEWIRALPDGLLDIMEEVLTQLEEETGSSLLPATMCLLEASNSGLRECELLAILASEQELSTSSVYEEKDEKESSEKEGTKRPDPAVESVWRNVYSALQPYLRPYGDSREGRLDFYHRALSKAVRRRYFKVSEDMESTEESQHIFLFWHKKLADYFQNCDSVDRKVEEYLYQLSKIGDADRLSQCLCEWPVFDRLYNEEYSPKLINYWRKAGGVEELMMNYQTSLTEMERVPNPNENLMAAYYQKVARVLLQAGKYSESLDLAKVALKMEERELGNRPEKMVELYYLMAEIYDEKLKLHDFVSVSQLPDLRKTISYGKKSIELRKSMPGDYQRFKYGMSLMRLAFSLESWEACGGDSTMSADEAIKQGNEHIDDALEIFKELKDDGHYAEALMTKGVLAKRGSSEQLKFYDQAKELCVQLYGEHHILASRLYINIGIVYEDRGDYVKAYEYFRDWARVSDSVLGSDHPKTLRAKGVLREPRYQLVAQRLKARQEAQDENQDPPINNDQINEEADDVTPASLQNLIEEYAHEDDPEQLNNAVLNYHGEDDNYQSHGQNLLAAAEALSQALSEILERATGEEQDIEELRNLMNSAMNRMPHDDEEEDNESDNPDNNVDNSENG